MSAHYKDVVYLGIMALLLTLLVVSLVSDEPLGKTTGSLDNNAVYMGAATIIGLATFGSILGLRITITSESYKKKLKAVGMIIYGATGVAIIQGCLMVFLCCVKLPPSVLFIANALTVIGIGAILLGVAMMMDEQFSHHGPNPPGASQN